MSNQSCARKDSYSAALYGSAYSRFNCGFNTTVLASSQGKQAVDQLLPNINEEDESARQLQGRTFTRDQYNQILQMLKQNKW